MNTDFEIEKMKADGDNIEKIFQIFRSVLGFAMVLGGTAVAVWVFLQVYNVVVDPEKLAAFKNLVPANLEFAGNIANNKTQLTIPGDFLAYLIPIILLLIAAKIGLGIAKSGVELMYGNLQKLLLKIIDLEHQTGKHVDSRISPLVKRLEHLESMIVYEEPKG